MELGKSTTIRSIMNLINKTSGKVLIENKEFDKDDIKIKEKIGYLPSEIYLYNDLTVKEMLDYHESFYKKDIHKRRTELVKKLQQLFLHYVYFYQHLHTKRRKLLE